MATLLAVLLCASYGYFYEGGGWNQNTRFDLVRALLEQHTLTIDAYHENTGDKARIGDHYYMDKAPGASFTALPAVALARTLVSVSGGNPASDRAVTGLSYVATLAASALPAAVASLCVFLIGLRLTGDRGAALFAALVCGVATPLWAYATLLYGHALAAGCLMAAFLCALRLADGGVQARRGGLALTLGLTAGWTVITEYPASIPAGLIVLFGVWQTPRDGAARRTVVLAAGCGLAVPAVLLLIYNYLSFGTPLHIGYASEEGFEAMQTGLFGVQWPDLSVLSELLFGYQRGVLPLAPVLAIVPFGLLMMVRRPAERPAGLMAIAIAGYFFMMTSGYAYWSGGWSYGSRHLGPALPFLCLGAVSVWARSGAIVRAVLVALTIVSAAQTLVAVATTPQPPIQFADPMRQLLWPAFASGDFPIGWQSFTQMGPPPGPMSQLARDGVPRASWNVGQLLGLRGHASLLPLAAVWLMVGLGWARLRPPQDRDQKR